MKFLSIMCLFAVHYSDVSTRFNHNRPRRARNNLDIQQQIVEGRGQYAKDDYVSSHGGSSNIRIVAAFSSATYNVIHNNTDNADQRYEDVFSLIQ